MVGSVVFLRPESPSVPASVVSVVKGDHIVVEEISGPSSSRVAEGGLRNHGISFKQGVGRIDSCYESVEHLPENPSERSECPGQSCLHLRHMPLLVDGKHVHPWHRLSSVWLRRGEQVHLPWSPGYNPVGLCIVRMQDYGYPSPCVFPGDISDRPADRVFVFLQ